VLHGSVSRLTSLSTNETELLLNFQIYPTDLPLE
jgi:hypothetical protein